MKFNRSTVTHDLRYRFFALGSIIIIRLSIFGILYAPAAIADQIIQDLDISKSQFGFVISLPNAIIIVSGLLGSVFVDHLGARRAFITGLLVLGIGGSAVYIVSSLPQFVFIRILQGMGIAITFPVTGALIMEWFTPNQKAYVNTTVSMFVHGGLGTAWAASAGIVEQSGQSWNSLLSLYGVVVLAVMTSWVFLGKDVQVLPLMRSRERHANPLTTSHPRVGSLSRAIRMPVAWRLTAGIFANSWVFSLYLSFLPLFLQSDKRVSPRNGAFPASLLLFSGVVGVLVLGILSTKSHLRKHLLWLSCVMITMGSSALIFGGQILVYVGLVLTGFGLSGIMPVFFTYVMGLPKMTPSLVAAFLVMANTAVYSGSFISPFLAGILSESELGFRYTIALLSAMELVAIIMFWRLPKEK